MSRYAILGLTLFLSPFLVAVGAAAEDVSPDVTALADAPPTDTAPASTYLLRYKFKPGEMVRWKVVHQALVRSTVSGTTQTAETRSESVKVWQVKEVETESNQATFVHSVESVDMRQSVSGRQDIRYNSLTDTVPPAEFEEVAKAVGVPLSFVVLNDRGLVIKRKEERAQPNASPGEMTIPLPENAVAVKETWSLPHDANVRQKDGTSKQVKTRQDFTLVEVEKGIATIRVETVVLTPIRDPALEAQLIQHVTDGTIRFDIAAGRVVGQQVDIDKRVIGFQGEASSMHYVTRFTEELMTEATASRAPAVASAKGGKKVAKPKADTADAAAVDATKKPAAETTAAVEDAAEPGPPKLEKKPATASKGAKPTVGAAKAPPRTAARTPSKAATKPATKPAPKAAAKPSPKAKTGSRPATNQPQQRR